MSHQDLMLQTVEQFAKELGFPGNIDFSVDHDPESESYQILIQTQNPGPLIGYHGETLSALQLMINQHVHTQTGQWLNISLNVNDYRERREVTLKNLADSAISQVKQTLTPHSLPPMPSSERRYIHLYLKDHPDVVTTSEGVGKKRYIIISPKNAS